MGGNTVLLKSLKVRGGYAGILKSSAGREGFFSTSLPPLGAKKRANKEKDAGHEIGAHA